MSQRDLTDADGLQWTCVQAYAGLAGEDGDDGPAGIAQRIADRGGRLPLVCTPTGGAQSVRLKVPPDWAERMGDDELLAAIAREQAAS